MKKAYLYLSNGMTFSGISIGKTSGYSISEIVFNTGMTGYQEVLTDPSYYGQSVCMTYPLIGNYGINNDDSESKRIWVKGFIIRNLSNIYSNFRAEISLNQYLVNNNIIGISNIDTRFLVKVLRDSGTMTGIIYTEDIKLTNDLIEKMHNYKIINAVKTVTTNSIYKLNSKNGKYNVALLDLGVKNNIINELLKLQCNVTIFPADVSPDEILNNNNFDGIMLTNGPGDPSENKIIINNIKEIIKFKIPIFGICLGHQLLALAMNAKTIKLKYGHRGSNHPVMDLNCNRTYITSQNHGYAVDFKSLDNKFAQVTHINVNDNTVEGINYINHNIFSVQYHPEASPGPLDSKYLFNKFIKRMEIYKLGGNN